MIDSMPLSTTVRGSSTGQGPLCMEEVAGGLSLSIKDTYVVNDDIRLDRTAVSLAIDREILRNLQG